MNAIIKTSPLSIGAILVLAMAGEISGQTNPYLPRPGSVPYYPGYGGYNPGRVGGALQGQASVINANGELMIQTEQARQEREKANQAKLETKKKSFEEMMYEKANTATLTENLQYDQNLTLARLMQSPTPYEITSGKTLNAMLPMINSLALKGTMGPPIPIDPSILKYVNVTVGKDGANIGMLTGGGSNLDWPLCLQGAKQKKIATEIPTVVSQAKNGALDATAYRTLTKEIAVLNEDLRTKFHKDEIDGQEFLEGKRFIDSLTQSVTALRSPTAQRFLDGSYSARGNTVPELTYNMVNNGLSFTACNPGEEAVYNALHSKFVAYTSAAQSAAGIHVQYAPPRTEAFKNK